MYAWKGNELSRDANGAKRKWQRKYEKYERTWPGFTEEQLDTPKSACVCQEEKER